MALEVSFEKATNINGVFYDGTVVLKFLRCSPFSPSLLSPEKPGPLGHDCTILAFSKD